jgi:hypothetical protein
VVPAELGIVNLGQREATTLNGVLHMCKVVIVIAEGRVASRCKNTSHVEGLNGQIENFEMEGSFNFSFLCRLRKKN